MTRSKVPKEIKNRRREKKASTILIGVDSKPGRITRVLRLSGIVVTGAATLIGIVTGLLSLLPRISASQSDPLNTLQALSASFVISNDGPVGINDVELDCIIFKIESKTQNFAFEGPTRVTAPDNYASYLGPGERITTPCLFPVQVDNPVTFGDIAISVYFRPSFVPWYQEKLLRFITSVGPDGYLHWYPQPMPKSFTMPQTLKKKATKDRGKSFVDF
jgi:hypothetical protein